MDEQARRAADHRRLLSPDVTPAELADLAQRRPELRQLVAAHPAAYPELIAWITQQAPVVPPPAPVAPPAPVLPPVPVTPPTPQPRSPEAAPAAGRTTTRGSRAPWLVTAVALIVAVAAVAWAVVLPALGGSSAAGGLAAVIPQPHFATPEEAMEHVIENLAAGDTTLALEAFAIGTFVEDYDFVAYIERLDLIHPITSAPAEYAYYQDSIAADRLSLATRQFQGLAYTLVSPEWMPDILSMIYSPIEDRAPEFLAALDPSRIEGLRLVRVDDWALIHDVARNHAIQASIYGADEYRDYGALYEFEGQHYEGGFTMIRYGDSWQVFGISSQLGGIGGSASGSLRPTTVAEYDARLLP